MRTFGFGFVLLTLGLGAAALPAVADTTVHRIDGETLMVIDYQGKPPFKRRVVSASANPAEFARFEELSGTSAIAANSGVRRAGPPGKAMPGQGMSVSGESAEFARFEEGGDAGDRSRLWRGAPGKR